MDKVSLCAICDKPLINDTDTVATVREKGLATLIKKSEAREDGKHHQWIGKTSAEFHQTCRIRYLARALSKKPKEPEPEPEEVESESSSVTTNPTNFDFKGLCFICGKDFRHISKKTHAQSNTIKMKVLEAAKDKNDEGAHEIIKRLEGVKSLLAIDAGYHRLCFTRYTIKHVPKEPKVDEELEALIHKVTEYIEGADKFQFSLAELREVQGSEYLSTHVLFKRLKEKFGDDIYFIQTKGRHPLIFYKCINVSKICSDWFLDPSSLGDLEKRMIVSVAADMLRTEILKNTYDYESYPPPNQFIEKMLSDIPHLLLLFLNDLLKDKKGEHTDENFIKRDFIAHAIMSVLRPRSFISTLQLATSTWIYRKTGSRVLMEILAALGAAASYHHTQLWETSAIMNPSTTTFDDSTFVQFVFDSTDQNIGNLDGSDPFHCLGGIAAYTPGSGLKSQEGSKKYKKVPSPATLAAKKPIPIIPYGSINSTAMETIKFVAINKLRLGNPPVLSPSYAVYLWAKCSEIPKFPSWAGFMEAITHDISHSVSHIQCLPYIDQPPSSLDTINTSLHHAAAKSKELGQKTCFVSYDQPLYWKARSIVQSSIITDGNLKNVVVRLGTFHLLMAYLGSIGKIMEGSGIKDLWLLLYNPNTVKRLLKGFLFSRSVRAHMLTFTALGIKICKNLDLSDDVNESLQTMFQNWSSSPPALSGLNSTPDIQQLTETFTQTLTELEKTGPTAKLWTQYFRYATVILQMIESERLGNWQLHLQCIKQMLPVFHAAGRLDYAKSAHTYLQDMANLKTTMDKEEFNKFTKEGYWTVHRSEKLWSSICRDMTIEQAFNCFFAADLKHDKSTTSSTVSRQLLGMPAAFTVMKDFENYCGVISTIGEHGNTLSIKPERDDEDLEKLVVWLDEHDPFTPCSLLTSLSTEIVADPQTDCHMATEKGTQSLALMVGKSAADASLSTTSKVLTLADVKTGIRSNNETFRDIDPHVIVQRISKIFGVESEVMRSALAHELSPFPLSLFDEQGSMRTAPESESYQIFRPYILNQAILSNSLYVIDGKWLLHQVTWPQNKTYGEILQIYLTFVRERFGQNATIVFDGSSNEIVGIKSFEKRPRKTKSAVADSEVTENTLIKSNQSKFLCNSTNKCNLVRLLSTFLHRNGIMTHVTDADADTLTIRVAIQLKSQTNADVTIVSNDVDLLALLIAMTPAHDCFYFFKMTPDQNQNIIYRSSCHGDLQPFILFAQAFSGCKSTSTLFKKPKKIITSMLQTDGYLQSSIAVFYHQNRTDLELYAAVENLVLRLYCVNNLTETTIEKQRYEHWKSFASRRNELSLASLPPTRSALLEHCKRVYYQVQKWLGNQLDVQEWGWKKYGNVMLPVTSTEDPVPKGILEKVTCECQFNCTTNRCICKKNKMHCISSCANCDHTSCNNLQEAQRQTESEEDIESEEEVDDPEVLQQLENTVYNFLDPNEQMQMEIY